MSNQFFDFLNDLSHGKKMLLTQENESAYVPYVINEIFSRHADSIIYAEEMNERPNIPKRAHYLYMMNSMRARKRFGKMPKADRHEHFDIVREFYKYNISDTEEVFDILTPDQIDSIVKKMDRGGIK